jgi:hypothetical protein
MALAVFRLITSSNFIGCWDGQIGGRRPFEDLSLRTPRSLGKRANSDAQHKADEPNKSIGAGGTLEPITSKQATNGQRLLLIPGRPPSCRGGDFALRRDFVLFAGDFARRLRRSVGV